MAAAHETEWELYNLIIDPLEKNNLMDVHSEIAERLINNYIAWSKKHNVAKWPLK